MVYSKQEYLAKEEVQQFVQWLHSVVAGETQINYRHSRGSWVTLVDAMNAYAWPNKQNNGPNAFERVWTFPQQANFRLAANSTLQQNNTVLDRLQKGLKNAIVNPDEDIVPWLDAVFMWGGVARGGNTKWLERNRESLRQQLCSTLDAIELNLDELDLPELRFNSAMTKVYSLLAEDFVIYDSRVAGALAYLVEMWADGRGVSESLAFGCMPAAGNQCRNPNPAVFEYINNKAALHATWNIRANWTLESVVISPGVASTVAKEPTATGLNLREIEAALFMMGYDLPVTNPNPRAA